MVVNFRTSAPRAHCANVTRAARVSASARATAGYTQSGTCDAKRGHQATLAASPQSAGFSTPHVAPDSCAAPIRRAVKSASVLCLARKRLQRLGTGTTPSGCPRVRSCGRCATEKEAQGGAAKTMWKRPSRTHERSFSATAARATSWSWPPSAMSIVTMSAPSARSSNASVEGARPSPAKTMSARGASPRPRATLAAGGVGGDAPPVRPGDVHA
eukprot:2396843-Pleurochrysis_carterae.AAC.6